MKPGSSQNAYVAGLNRSIDITLEEIERQPDDIDSPGTFAALADAPGSIEVWMNCMRVATGDEVICTRGMGQCSAIILCTNYDESRGVFTERRLMHAGGSHVGFGDCAGYSEELVRAAEASSGKPLCIIALGGMVSVRDFSGSISCVTIETSDGATLNPLAALQAACDTLIIERVEAIAVRPDGSFELQRLDYHQG